MAKRVCVVGCGPAGLACIRYFTENPETFSVVAYEQGACIGGIWVYTDETGYDKHGRLIHGGIYDTLRKSRASVQTPKTPTIASNTNKRNKMPFISEYVNTLRVNTYRLPSNRFWQIFQQAISWLIKIMAYPDFPFSSSLPSFIGHREVLKYLNDYADHFDLRKHIVLDTRVVSVEPEDHGLALSNTKWRVSVQPADNPTGTTQQSIFDAVIVCNGNFSVPSMPRYQGLDKFRGQILHSKNYRRASEFRGKTVLTVGGSFSCWDITIDVAAKAKKVYMSHHHEQKYETFPDNVVLVTGIRYFNADGVVLTDNSTLVVDVVIFNTGYRYSFPFLSSDCGIELSEGGTVKNLYKHTFNITRPTLAFVSVVIGYIPFLGISLQARLVKAVLEGRICLPREEDMRKDEEAELRKRLDLKWPLKHRHKMAELQSSFYDDLCKMLKIEPVPDWVMKMYAYHFDRFFEDIENCKKYNYHVLDSGDFTFSEQPSYLKLNDF